MRKGFVFESENNKEIPFIIMNTKMKNGQMTMENFTQVEKNSWRTESTKKRPLINFSNYIFPYFLFISSSSSSTENGCL